MALLSIAFDLPSAPAALGLFQACMRRVGPIAERVLDRDSLLTRLVVTVKQEPRIYQALIECLSRVDEWAIRAYSLPPLYESGVRYEEEPAGEEVWQSSLALYLRGRGDCEDLAAHRAGEHRIAGKKARINMDLSGRAPFGGRLFHFNVRLPDGSIEDPSRRLGME